MCIQQREKYSKCLRRAPIGINHGLTRGKEEWSGNKSPRGEGFGAREV